MSVSHSEAWKLVDGVLDTSVEVKPKEAVDRVARIRKILDACKPINPDGEVAAYLRSRGITELPEGLLEASASKGSTMMVGRFSNGKKLTGLHVTFIRDGKKEERKMYGLKEKGLMGSAIRLHSVGSGSRIIVGEGIETTLSLCNMYGLPGWACGSAGMMERLEVPNNITEVIVAADNDESFTGQASGFLLAKNLTIQKKCVTVCMPKKFGTDWNDELLEAT
jgi:putative DNA primase/helicase